MTSNRKIVLLYFHHIITHAWRDIEHHPLPQHTATSMTATSHNDAERTINDCHFTRSAHGHKRTVSLFSFEAN